MTLEELLHLARESDEAAREELFHQTANYVFKTLYRLGEPLNRAVSGSLILDRVEYKDVVQDVTRLAFAEAFSDLPSFDSTRSSFTTWTVWKGRKHLAKVIRKAIRAKIEQALSIDATPEDLPEELRDDFLPDPWRTTPERYVLAQERQQEYRAKIEVVLRALSAEQERAVLLVHGVYAHLGNGRIKAATEATGRSHEAMDSLLRRAERRFRNEWESRFGPADF